MKVTGLKAFIYADDIMIWGNNVKELEIRLAHWERESKSYNLHINLKTTVMLQLLRKEEKNTTLKISGSKIKHVDRLTYLGSAAEKNGEKHNKINERIRKDS
jgi:hypothetical protein